MVLTQVQALHTISNNRRGFNYRNHVTAGGSGYTGSPTVKITAYGPKVRNESDYESSVESGTNIYQWERKGCGRTFKLFESLHH